MFVIINGELVREEEAKVSVFDRGFLYGDGLYETTRVAKGRPFCWAEHLARFKHGLGVLDMAIPFADGKLGEQVMELIERNRAAESVLRVVATRGVGPRGFSPKSAKQSTVVISTHPLPEIARSVARQYRVVVSAVAHAGPRELFSFKHCNRLPQVLARKEADERGAEEALLCNASGEVVEASGANLFWIENGVVKGPGLEKGILPGVTRGVVLGICGRLGIRFEDGAVTSDKLAGMEGVFLTQSVVGVAEVVSVDGRKMERSEVVRRLAEEYERMLGGE